MTKIMNWFYAAILVAVLAFIVACMSSQKFRFYFGLATAADISDVTQNL